MRDTTIRSSRVSFFFLVSPSSPSSSFSFSYVSLVFYFEIVKIGKYSLEIEADYGVCIFGSSGERFFLLVSIKYTLSKNVKHTMRDA